MSGYRDAEVEEDSAKRNVQTVLEMDRGVIGFDRDVYAGNASNARFSVGSAPTGYRFAGKRGAGSSRWFFNSILAFHSWGCLADCATTTARRYVSGESVLGTQSVIDQFLIGLDTWAGLSRAAGKGHSLGGTFMALEDPYASYNIPQI